MEHADTAMRRAGTRGPGPAVALFTLGILVTCIRFPPADLTGWIAQTLGIPLGVPFLFTALLFGGAAWILHTPNSRHRVLRVVSLIAAIASAITGVFTISTSV
ncbi:hypothetical protein [Labedella endophytica]|uniref:Uncharacterized protein n=1 Tax=Labedella endophytica TaxID=1523160 RepID=A0A433JPZ3_9MICO|nr:hypothetical protein [Labedella endophytica]RUQ98191.1 hypothetical protein ELQ94_14320 [Labedella endophytica]